MQEKSELHLQILRKIEKTKDQKSLADEIGCSVGKISYVLKALIDKGLIKTQRFVKSENKKAYRYLLTQKGIEEKLNLTKKFIEIKKREYEELQKEL